MPSPSNTHPSLALAAPLSPLPKQLFMPPPVAEPVSTPPNVPYARTGTIPTTATARTASRPSHRLDILPIPPHRQPHRRDARLAAGQYGPAVRKTRHTHGIIIFPHAKPPQNVVEQALELRTPPPSPPPPPLQDNPVVSSDVLSPRTPAPSAPSSTVPSSSVTDVTDTLESPVSSSTSLSASVSVTGMPGKDIAKEAPASPVASIPLPPCAPEEHPESAIQPPPPGIAAQTQPDHISPPEPQATLSRPPCQEIMGFPPSNAHFPRIVHPKTAQRTPHILRRRHLHPRIVHHHSATGTATLAPETQRNPRTAHLCSSARNWVCVGGQVVGPDGTARSYSPTRVDQLWQHVLCQLCAAGARVLPAVPQAVR
ncbi:hypothetical protein Hypma_010771 [Hypsizygus marmoreus]|uniref:Uncharacterized protein n=1 Tax=Hypsizygus marmoreus TaxID=39966 RepID=A0A369JRX4_HYPMA|nr:hypothetical protein Hypma_010771 [Hypsizygus marmoreus]